jgi:hypothetical protein
MHSAIAMQMQMQGVQQMRPPMVMQQQQHHKQ